MKGKAVIVLCCVLAYMAGWMAVPRMMEPVRKDCCAKAMGKKGAHHCPKDDKGDKGCMDCGVSCPMCYTMLMPATSLEEAAVMVARRSYPDVHAAYRFRFHPVAWKPPDGV